jgi:hypothetical protein
MNADKMKKIEALSRLVMERMASYCLQTKKNSMVLIELPESRYVFDNCQKIAIALDFFQTNNYQVKGEALISVVDEVIHYVDLKARTLSTDIALFVAASVRNGVKPDFRVITGKRKEKSQLTFLEE